MVSALKWLSKSALYDNSVSISTNHQFIFCPDIIIHIIRPSDYILLWLFNNKLKYAPLIHKAAKCRCISFDVCKDHEDRN